MSDDLRFMERAIELAEKARGSTAPNPMVGAVVVSSQGQILGEGFHPGAGQPHAEVLALGAASSENFEQAPLYLTLEPCNHYGKTPPCPEFIVKSKIKNVVVGVLDPSVQMQGKSLSY